jgi:hypothetical protein
MKTGNTLGLGPLKENKKLVVEGVMVKPGDSPQPILEHGGFCGCVGHGGECVDAAGNRVDEGF